MDLTLDALHAAIERTKPIVYYAISRDVSRGKVLLIPSDDFYPEVWIFYEDDFTAQQDALSRYCRLVHIREWQPTAADAARTAEAWFKRPENAVSGLNRPLEGFGIRGWGDG